jgi:hypothetical protein
MAFWITSGLLSEEECEELGGVNWQWQSAAEILHQVHKPGIEGYLFNALSWSELLVPRLR